MIFCFKGISNRLYLFGVQPLDLAIILLIFVFVHGIFNSLALDIVFIIFAYWFAKKQKNRPDGYFISLLMYFVSPPVLTVPNKLEKTK